MYTRILYCMPKLHQCAYTKCKQMTTNPKFCSLSCGAKQQSMDKPKKMALVERTCIRDGCEQTFSTERYNPRKYCSRSCAAIVNNTISVKRPSKKMYVQCLYCMSDLVSSAKQVRKFCSVQCAGKYEKQQRIQAWLEGRWNGTVKTGLSITIRNYLLEQAQYHCQSPTCCVKGGWGEINPATGHSPLEIDHIDGDAYNNKPDNLIVLCPNCHALTGTYRTLNKVSSRTYRKNYRYTK